MIMWEAGHCASDNVTIANAEVPMQDPQDLVEQFPREAVEAEPLPAGQRRGKQPALPPTAAASRAGTVVVSAPAAAAICSGAVGERKFRRL